MKLTTLFFLSILPLMAEKPNLVYILADDLGYGDLKVCNPDCKIATPGTGQMGKEGMSFTDAHSGSAVCTPTRYGILTGTKSVDCGATKIRRVDRGCLRPGEPTAAEQ